MTWKRLALLGINWPKTCHFYFLFLSLFVHLRRINICVATSNNKLSLSW